MQEKVLLTTVILTNNSSETIDSLLQAASKWSDQLILLDDYSEVVQLLQAKAKLFSAEIIQHKLGKDFAAHRNSVFSEIRGEWTLFLDADEQPTEDFWSEMHTALQSEHFDAYLINRRNVFLGKQLKYGEAGEKKLLRLARTKLGEGKWRRAVHEVWQVDTDKIGSIQALVLHQQPKSITAFVQKLNTYSQLEKTLRSKQSRVRIFLEVAVYPLGKFLWNYLCKQGFRDGFAGLALAFLMSYYSLIVRVQQYEKTL